MLNMKIGRTLERINYCIRETEEKLKEYEEKYKSVPYGNYAIDLTMSINQIKGELKAYREMKEYIEVFVQE